MRKNKSSGQSLIIFLTFLLLLFCSNPVTSFSQANPERYLYEAESFFNDALKNQQISAADIQPAKTGSAVLTADNDDDGMADTWETTNSLNPADPHDAWADGDSDQVINLFEYQLGSDPNSSLSPTALFVSPGENFNNALSSATAGQIVKVAAGSYYSHYLNFSAKTMMIQGGWDSTFTTRAPSANITVLDGGGTGEVLYFSIATGTGNVVLEGLTLTKGKGSFGGLNFYNSGSSVSNFCMKDCIVSNSQSTFSFGGAININHKDSSYSEVFFINTVVANDSSSGVYTQTVDKGVGKWKIINSTITNNASLDTDEGFGLRGFTLTPPSTISISIKNSILWGNQKKAIYLAANGGPVNIAAVYSDIDTVMQTLGVNYSAGTGMINANPLFSDPASDYHLSFGSPCINTGTNVGLPFWENAPDMGAFETDVTGITENGRNGSYRIYPVPFTHEATISFSMKIPCNSEFIVFDPLGRIVKTEIINSSPFHFVRNGIPGGLYFFQLRGNNEIIAGGKLLIE